MSTANPSQPRSRSRFPIFLTGATLLALSSLLTRRALNLRRKSVFPAFYHPSNQQPLLKINGRLEAYQALGIATMNVVSFFVMTGGGLLWAFEIGGVEDLRRRVGRVDGRWRERGGRGEDEVEFEKWVASLTGRKLGEERRWSARERNDGEERAGEKGYAVGEPPVTNEKGKSR